MAPSAAPAHTPALGPATKRLSPITLLKNALHHWHRPAAFAKVGLEQHPAIHQLLTAQASATLTEDFNTQLRRILIDGINRLKPDPAAGPLNDRSADQCRQPYGVAAATY